MATTNPTTRAARRRGQLWLAWLPMLRHGILLGFLIALSFSFSASQAQATQIACGDGEQNCRVSGGFSAVSVENPTLPGVTSPSTPAFGALVYTDFVQIEQEARVRLQRGLDMRKAISPYRENTGFEDFLSKLDAESGLSQVYPVPTPYQQGLKFIEIVNLVEKDLTEARNLYAFLAVFAPEHRFRTDGAYTAFLCGTTNKEDPDPADPLNSGQVLDPVIDWCNFRARLRQSVREAANVRMIVGQQFMVSALGMNFSGGFIGGEDFVRKEVAQLRAARFQFEQAEKFLTSALKVATGNGCLISDFYTQSEWSLLSRAAERQGVAQSQIATRLSYLDVGNEQGLPQARANATTAFRSGAADTYVKMIALAASGRAPTGRCAIGERPEGALVADMTLNLLNTQRQARELAAGRNVFGFDVTFTPARPYKSSVALNCATNAAANRGLWDEAYCSADFARVLQDRAENTERIFDESQSDLRAAINAIRLGLDLKMDDTVGCNRSALGNDEEFFTCVEEQLTAVRGCLALAHVPGAAFATCMASKDVNVDNDASTALFELRGIYLEYDAIQKSAMNIWQRVQASNDANATVTKWLGLAGGAETVARVSQVAFDTITCVDFDNLVSTKASAIACSGAGQYNAIVQGLAGSLSTAADVKIADAENEKEITNLLIDMSELVISAQAAQQAYFAKKSDVTGMFDALERDLLETQRQRAYFASSPANDPSFRIVRDSARLELADALDRAARIAYLAARRAEYEYAARLSASNFRISDIYRARTSQDILAYLNALQGVTGSLPGSTSQESTAIDLRISVAKDVLQLTDAVLASEGFTTTEAIEAERTRRFRAWAAQNTVPNSFEAPFDDKPVLRFTLTTSLLNSGLFAGLIPQGYDRQWRLVLGGIGTPKSSNTGVSVNLVSAQSGPLSYRKVAMTQGGLVHLRSQAGCTFDYRLMAPATLLGLEWAANQSPEQATAFFNANVNEANAYTVNGFRTERFEGRAISSTEWIVQVFAGAPEGGLAEMDLQQLNDIELLMSATYVSRSPGTPEPSACSRIDF